MSKHYNQIISDFQPIILKGSGNQLKLKAQREGKTTTKNKNSNLAVNIKMAKLDNDHESTKIEKVSSTLSELIKKGRLSKKLTQKELANKANMIVSDIQKYENGTGIPKHDQIQKLQRILGIKLTGLNKKNKKT